MARYLVEAYVPGRRAREVSASEQVVVESAKELSGEGPALRVVRTTTIPADDTCFYLVEADSIEVVRELCLRAGLESARVVEAFEHPSDP